jgi:hypothetical protein
MYHRVGRKFTHDQPNVVDQALPVVLEEIQADEVTCSGCAERFSGKQGLV